MRGMTLPVAVVAAIILGTINTTTWSRGDGGWVEASSSASSSIANHHPPSSYSRQKLFKFKGGKKGSNYSYYEAEGEQDDDDQEEEEFVASFYKRAQEKQRALINGYAARNNGGGELFGSACSSSIASSSQRRREDVDDDAVVDHSLDHYFHHRHDHHSKSASATAVDSLTANATNKSRPSSWSMRGGGTMMMTMTTTPLEDGSHHHHPHLYHPQTGDNASRSSSTRGGGQLNPHYSNSSARNHHHHRRHQQQEKRHHANDKGRKSNEALRHRSESTRLFRSSSSLSRDEEVDDDDQEEEEEFSHYQKNDVNSDDDDAEDDDSSAAEHHFPGLLRVPCSITINSGNEEEEEESSLLSSFPHHHHHKKTPMAAFVDTGAQVTVISASAARRAGIYHLMDRRYAGRATGVGHCKVLGRIPARHVYFLLGGKEEELGENEGRRDRDFHASNNNHDDHHHTIGSAVVQMDGPALTVIEGTVTKGVDILLGLDVLQDWEAEIRMGPTMKSITVKRRTRRKKGTYYSSASFGGGAGTTSAVVIPFVTSGRGSREGNKSACNDNIRYPSSKNKDRTRNHSTNHSFFDNFRSISNSGGGSVGHYHRQASQHPTALASIDYCKEVKEEEEDDDFSPIASDIESDLDLLDQSGHEFPDNDCRRRKRQIRSGDNILLGSTVGGWKNGSNLRHVLDSNLPFGVIGANDDVNEEDEDYLQDVDDCVVDELEGDIDMSGL